MAVRIAVQTSWESFVAYNDNSDIAKFNEIFEKLTYCILAKKMDDCYILL